MLNNPAVIAAYIGTRPVASSGTNLSRDETTMATMIAARIAQLRRADDARPDPVPEPRPTDVLVEVKMCGVVPN